MIVGRADGIPLYAVETVRMLLAEGKLALDGERYIPTELTGGPWDPDAQHAGPPAALMWRAIEACPPGGQVGRVTFEILGPVRPFQLDRLVRRVLRR